MFDLDIQAGVARLVLNRPEARNAIPLAEWPRLGTLAAEAEGSAARLLIISGEGGAFCAGADLSDFAELARNEAARTRFRIAMRDALERIRGLSIPTIAYIRGPCFGAGVALAMACDIRVAGPNARLAITPAKFGISYPHEDLHRLVSLVGSGQAARLLFGARTIGGAEARRIGLVELDGDQELDLLIAAILANSADSLRILKRGIRLAADGFARDEEQDRSFDALFGSSDFANRLAALRPPRDG